MIWSFWVHLYKLGQVYIKFPIDPNVNDFVLVLLAGTGSSFIAHFNS